MKPLTDSMDFEVDEATFCWNVIGAVQQNGYKPICRGINKQPVIFYAHRVAFEMGHRPLKPGEQVIHTCDNPRCINPDHLSAGTPRDNSVDCFRKERGVAQLTIEQATEILLDPNWNHKSTKQYALKWGVSLSVIYRVRHPRGWVWLKEDLGFKVTPPERLKAERELANMRSREYYRQRVGPRKEPSLLTTYQRKLRNGQHHLITPEERAYNAERIKQCYIKRRARAEQNGELDKFKQACAQRSKSVYQRWRQDPVKYAALQARSRELRSLWTEEQIERRREYAREWHKAKKEAKQKQKQQNEQQEQQNED